MNKILVSVLATFGLCLWSACSSPGRVVQEFPADPQAAGYVMLQRPLSLPQGNVIYDCGPEAITAVLNYYGQSVNVDEASKVLYNPKLKGTLSFELAPYARRKGLATRYAEGSLGKIRDAIQRQVPPIIMFEASGIMAPVSGTYFHFFVISGYNDQDQVVVAEFYNNHKFLIPYSELEYRWSKTKSFYLEVVPADAFETVRMAQDLEGRGQNREAMALYKKAIEKDPEYHPAVLGLGNTSYRLGDKTQALASYEQANQLDPYDPVTMNNLAHMYVENGQNLDTAATLARKAALVYRTRYAALKAHAEMETDEAVREKARAESKRLQIEYALAHGTLGQVFYAQKQTAEAIAAWKVALTVTPESETQVRAVRHFEIGRAYKDSGIPDQAKEHLLKALELATDAELKKAIQDVMPK